ncbi:putative Multi-sensor signal transduction histidine kinase [Candidatus Accumulibacter aalborgensis]|uniref:histidine kinase n=1 Tax=Candidatus Accumulibacter aalborgensis TaxID=1860102 RepID=A0A1A8XYC4_9PROT|nr:PAS domain S-box protein [Candidatus Accumulibacter aalborgensis]SBT09058.1 putative Multi-sensor signal transduction histidine kinase [Candidatus Accumulibacter aalborgensis]
MINELGRLLAVNDYLPHGYCLSWSPPLVLTYVVSDILIFLAYFSMPLAIGHFARRRKDFPYRWLLWLFAAFIMACGATHLMGAIVLWQPMYGLDALLKALTAVISVVTAFALWPLLPHALKLPSPDQLRQANRDLQSEIAERRLVEEALRLAMKAAADSAQEDRMLMAAIVQSSGDAIVGATLDGMITSWNRAAEDIFGYREEEILGHSMLLLVPPEHQNEEEQMLATIRRGESIRDVETVHVAKDGRRIDVSLTVSPIRNKEGQIIGGSQIARDITRRNMAEATLKESESLLRAVFDHAAVGIAQVSTTGRFLQINQEYCRIIAYSRDEALSQGLTFQQITFPEDLPTDLENINALLDGSSDRYALEKRYVRKDGGIVWASLSVYLLRNDSGAPLYLISAAQDITRRKQAETERRSALEQLTRSNSTLIALNEKLEQTQGQLLQSEKMAAIGQLAAGVAHEINNPVGFVYSNLGSLKEYLTGLLRLVDAYHRAAKSCSPGDPVLQEADRLARDFDLDFVRHDAIALLAETKDGLERVKCIVRDMREFSHSDGAEWQTVDLHKCLDSTLNMVWNELKYRVTLVKDYGDLPDIHCLPSQLSQVFMNLLINAAHAIGERGTIALRTGREADTVWVEVEDSGVGISPGNLAHIFEPFFTTKPVGSGTGLGLAVSYGIIRKHQGHIDVRSELGQGTTFRVILPIHSPGPGAPSTAAAPILAHPQGDPSCR